MISKLFDDLFSNGSFESQIAAICDDIAYNNNDIDDGLHAELFSIDELEKIEIVNNSLKKIKLKNMNKNLNRIKYELVRGLIKLMIDDLIENTRLNLTKFKI